MIPFKRNTIDQRETLMVGKKVKILNWLKDNAGIKEKSIEFNNDLSINIYGDVNLINVKLKSLPNFIKFKRVYGNFWAAGNDWQTLDGFPEEVYEQLQLDSVSVPSNCVKFTENYIRKKIYVHGKLWH